MAPPDIPGAASPLADTPGAALPLRIGAVGYLNARPLTWALDREPSRWQVRYDLPSVCARLLQDGEVDLGLVPSIEYLQAPDYRFVPGVGVTSRGAIASGGVPRGCSSAANRTTRSSTCRRR